MIKKFSLVYDLEDFKDFINSTRDYPIRNVEFEEPAHNDDLNDIIAVCTIKETND